MTSRLLVPVRLVLGLALCLAVLGVTITLPVPRAEAAAGSEGAFASKINGLRASKGLPALQYDGQLTGVARAWASHMADVGSISHNPSLSSQVTSNWRKLGENVGTGGDVDSLHQAFVNSPGHYANLVDPAFTHFGIGVVERNGVLWTA
ncbi:MAG: CAP domain-containing protein, partial [Actinomycetota bacterium]|nr:CAP domain-containing protein [Actinomycetota bacterium]